MKTVTEAPQAGEVPFVAPAITDDTRAFWTGGARGALNIQRCNDCATYLHPPVPVCRHCRSTNVGPQAVSGRGTVVSYTVNYQPWSDKYSGPYVVGLVGIVEQEGVNLVTNIVGCAAQDVFIGMPVQVAFKGLGEAWLPVFRPVD